MTEKNEIDDLQGILFCPECKSELLIRSKFFECSRCKEKYSVTESGFFSLLGKNMRLPETTVEEYAHSQLLKGKRLFGEYLDLLFEQEDYETALEVGCGMGTICNLLREKGKEAYGIDLPNLGRFWREAGNSPSVFFHAIGEKLPFRSDYFDIVFSLGVIEHIGTETGDVTLREDFRDARLLFARELVRVTRPGGRIIISCPNKNFPVDIQHAPGDKVTSAGKLRTLLWDKLGITLHKITGKYHLLSYREAKQLFLQEAGASSFRPLPLKNYFGFSASLFSERRNFIRSFLIKLANFYLNNLPEFLRQTGFNPYLLIEVKK